MKCKLGIITDF